MKRSEMVGWLAGTLSAYKGFKNRHPEDLVPLADYTLKALENFDMMPPTIINPKYKDVQDYILQKVVANQLNDTIEPYEINAWEPEDD